MNENRVWLVTGAASGLGRALAERVIAGGDRLVACSRRPEALADLESGAEDRVLAVRLDVTDPDQCAAAVAAARERFGRIDVLVNGAGVGLHGPLENLDEAMIRRQLEVNYLAPTRLIRALLPEMRERRSGRIVNIVAIAAENPEPGFCAYAGAKAALSSLSDTLGLELAPLGISVIAVQPGPFRTEFISNSVDFVAGHEDYAPSVGLFRATLEKIDGKQPGDPARAAEVIHEAAISDDPPRRLHLGTYAHVTARRGLEARMKELEDWKDRARRLEFDPRRG